MKTNMYKPIQLQNTTTPSVKNSINRSPSWCGLCLIAFALACFALSPPAQAVSPPPDGGYPGNNTAEGDNALFSLTSGFNDTAIGTEALFSNTTGTSNTATGTGALHLNTTGNENTATGTNALVNNTTGGSNIATGG